MMGDRTELDKIAPLLHRLEALKRATEENDPEDMAADGVTCAQVWDKELREIAKPCARCCSRCIDMMSQQMIEWDPPEAEEYYRHLHKMYADAFKDAYGPAAPTAEIDKQRWRRAYAATAVIRNELRRVYTDHSRPVMIVPKPEVH
jgi:hypothetical protein